LDENEEKYVFRDNLKAAFAEFGKVLFVDQRDETGNCVLRFGDSEEVKSAHKAIMEDKKKIREKELNVEIIVGEEEQKYWEDNIMGKPLKKKRFNKNNRS